MHNESPAPWHSWLDAILIINLDHRKDRMDHFLSNVCARFGAPYEKVCRVPAVFLPETPMLGCSLSHIAVLEYLLGEEEVAGKHSRNVARSELAKRPPLRNDWSYVMVCEDDFRWTCRKRAVLNCVFSKILQKDSPAGNGDGVWFDVLQLTASSGGFVVDDQGSELLCNLPESNEEHFYLKRLRSSQTTGGYILRNNRWFLQRLLYNFKFGAKKQEESGGGEWAIDQHWKTLQKDPKCRWFVTKPLLAKQNAGYSDIQKSYQKYDGPAGYDMK